MGNSFKKKKKKIEKNWEAFGFKDILQSVSDRHGFVFDEANLLEVLFFLLSSPAVFHNHEKFGRRKG